MALRRILATSSRPVVPQAGIATRFEQIMDPEYFKKWNAKKKEVKKTVSREQMFEFGKKLLEEKAKGIWRPPPLAKFEVDPGVKAINAPESELSEFYQHPYFIARYREWRQPGFKSPLTKLAPVVNEFKLPVKAPTKWIEAVRTQEIEYMDLLCCVTPILGWDGCAETQEFMEELMEATLKTKGLRASKIGVGWCAYNLKIMFDFKFQYGKNPSEKMWNILLRAAVLEGEWRLGYLIEDFMTEKKMNIDDAALKRIDEIAYEAHLKGWTLPLKYKNADINTALTCKTVGGVGAYVAPYKGEPWGFALWREHQKAEADAANEITSTAKPGGPVTHGATA